MNLYEEDSYKSALKNKLREKKNNISSKFNYSRMADACRLKKTYLSRVLNSDSSHLSEEQLHQAGLFLGLDKNEREFLQLLRRRDRCQNESIRSEWNGDVESSRKANMKTDRYLKVKESETSSTDWTLYYTDPLIMLTHIFLTIRRFQENFKLIKTELGIDDSRFSEILTTLESMGLIKIEGDQCWVYENKTHLPPDSPIYRNFRAMQRLKTIEKIDKLNSEKAFGFSVAFSSNDKVRKEIHRRLLNLIGEFEGLVEKGSEEDVYQLNIDLFDWT